MKKLGTFLLSSMLLLMNSCSETSSPGLEWLGDEVAVRFTATMQPSVEIAPTRGMIKSLPTEEGENQVGIYGLLTGSKNREESEAFEWKEGTTVKFHQEMKNKQYFIEEGNTLSPNGKVDYHPSRGTSAMAVYAYWPYSSAPDKDGYIPVRLGNQHDLLYTGKVLSIVNKETESFDPIQLPFKHAMGAVAFRFYTDDDGLDGVGITHIILTLNYDPENLKMRVTDGSFKTNMNDKEEGYGYWIGFPENTTVMHSSEQITPIAHTMLVPGEEYKITKLGLYYKDGSHSEKTLENPISVEQGSMYVLNINCTQANGYVPQLIVEKTGNVSSELPAL